MKRALRSFGDRFGNGLYGNQSPVNIPPRPERVPAQTNGSSGQPPGNRPVRQAQSGRNESQVERLRGRLIELAEKQGFDEDGVRSTVMDRLGKSLDDLTADEIGPLVEAAANKLNQMRQAQTA